MYQSSESSLVTILMARQSHGSMTYLGNYLERRVPVESYCIKAFSDLLDSRISAVRRRASKGTIGKLSHRGWLLNMDQVRATMITFDQESHKQILRYCQGFRFGSHYILLSDPVHMVVVPEFHRGDTQIASAKSARRYLQPGTDSLGPGSSDWPTLGSG